MRDENSLKSTLVNKFPRVISIYMMCEINLFLTTRNIGKWEKKLRI